MLETVLIIILMVVVMGIGGHIIKDYVEARTKLDNQKPRSAIIFTILNIGIDFSVLLLFGIKVFIIISVVCFVIKLIIAIDQEIKNGKKD